jgi:hypothetical protein
MRPFCFESVKRTARSQGESYRSPETKAWFPVSFVSISITLADVYEDRYRRLGDRKANLFLAIPQATEHAAALEPNSTMKRSVLTLITVLIGAAFIVSCTQQGTTATSTTGAATAKVSPSPSPAKKKKTTTKKKAAETEASPSPSESASPAPTP